MHKSGHTMTRLAWERVDELKAHAAACGQCSPVSQETPDEFWARKILEGHVHHGNPCRCQLSGNDAANRTPEHQKGSVAPLDKEVGE